MTLVFRNFVYNFANILSKNAKKILNGYSLVGNVREFVCEIFCIQVKNTRFIEHYKMFMEHFLAITRT